VNVSWSLQNRSALVRVPAAREQATRVEVRLADAAANPYLAIAVQLAAGLEGVRTDAEPGEPVNRNVWEIGFRERRRLKIEVLPTDLGDALTQLGTDRVIRAALGEHIFAHYGETKRREWAAFLEEVHPWEVGRYLIS
jgi:glutamine synthetase